MADGPLSRAQVVQCIVLGLVCVVLASAAVAFMDSRASFPPTTPEHAVEAFVDAFNAKEFEKLCVLSSPEIRREFESVGFDPAPDIEAVDRAIDRAEDRPDLIGCLMGAEKVSGRIGRISSGAVSKTARETRLLAYATTSRGRWKLTSDGETWTVARHPRLEALAEDGDGQRQAPTNLRRGAGVFPPDHQPGKAKTMFRINLKHSLAIAAVAVGVLAPAGSASAAPVYNGHAGLGASVYQHNQTDTEYLAAVSDGTSNTIMFGARGASVIESIGTKYTKNEVTIETLWFVPDVDDEVL